MVDLTKSSLLKLGIFQLRGIGREIGVKSPTTQRKEDIIEEILAIANGKKEAYVRPNAKGRPPLATSKFGLETSEPEDIGLWDFPTTDSLKVASVDDESDIISGFLVITTKGFGFVQQTFNVDSKTDAYIDANLIKKYNLRSGDILEVVVRQIPPKYITTVVDIIKINNVFKEKYEVNNTFKPIKATTPLGKIKNVHVFYGERVLIENDPSLVEEFYNSVNGTKFLVNANSLPEEFIENAINASCFDKPSTRYRTVDIVANRALRMAEAGENVVVCIMDIAFLPIAFMEYSSQTLTESVYTNEALLNLKQLISCGKNIEGAGSVTLVCGVNKNVSNSNYTLNNIKMLFNKVVD